MNLKKSAFSFLAILALTVSLFVPVAQVSAESSSATINEGGSFTNPGMWYGGVTFDPVTVTTTEGASTTKSGQYVQLGDNRAYSPGWQITMTASDLSDGHGHIVPASNLSVVHTHYGLYWTTGCPTVSSVPENPYQVLTGTGGTFTGPVALMTATAGRGCGSTIQGLYNFTLNVPAGTYTASNSAVYTGSLILTTTHNVP